jgi:exonuclease SbcC
MQALELSIQSAADKTTRPDTILDARKISELQAEIDSHHVTSAKLESLTQEVSSTVQRLRAAREKDAAQATRDASSALSLSEKLNSAKSELAVHEQNYARMTFEIGQLRRLEEESSSSTSKIATLKQETERAIRLNALLSGDRAQNKLMVPLSRFVLQSRFEEVLVQANRRLARMSRGQFQLRRPALSRNLRDSQGLEIRVEDSNAGTERHAGSLSGGESFMAALSLALGLADVVQADLGGVKLDTVLIDEGFGTLDSESLDLAMKTLIDLQAGGRIVGIISHVQELKNQVLHRLEVTKQPTGSKVDWNVSI